MIARFRACLTLSCLAAAALPAAAKDEWVKVRSPHFLVVGNANKGECQAAAFRLEQFRSALGQVLPARTGPDATPTILVLFKDDDSFRPFLSPALQKTSKQWSGYFAPGFDRHYVAIKLGEADPYPLVYSSYIDVTFGEVLGNAPPWLRVGFSEFYKTAEIVGAHLYLGKVARPVLQELQQAPFMPLGELLTVPWGSSLLQTPRRISSSMPRAGRSSTT